MATDINLEKTNERNQIVAGVTNVLPNLDAIDGNFTEVERVLCELQALIDTMSGTGGASTAAQLLVAKTNFDKLLADFTGTQAQELFDFIDGLDLAANVANISSYATSLSGFAASLELALDQVKTLTYTLSRPTDFTRLVAVLNGNEVDQDLPRALSINTNVVLDVPIGLRTRILADAQNNEVVSFLRGTLSDGRTITSPTVTLTEGTAPIIPFLYYGIIPDGGDVSAFVFDNQQRVEIVDNEAVFTIPPNVIEPTTDPVGPFAVLAAPADIFLQTLVNVPIGVNEIASWPFKGQVESNGQQFAIHGVGPLVLGATFTYRATFQ